MEESAHTAIPPLGADFGTRGLVLKVAAGAAVALAFLYYFARGVDFAEVGRAMRHASVGLLALALAAAIAGFYVRALRWRCYARPLRAVSFRTAFDSTMIGYMVSTFVPGRPGDFIVRPLLLERWEGLPKVATLATIAVERLFDTLMVLSAFAVYLAFLAPERLGDLDIAGARRLGYALLVASLVVVLLLAALRLRPRLFIGTLEGVLAPLSARLREPIVRHASSFAQGLNLFHDLPNAMWSVAYSVIAWVTVGLQIWLVTRALGLGIRAVDTMLLMGLGALGVAVPTPGGAGSFHVFMEMGLRALGVVDPAQAKAGAILIWLLTPIPITLLGLMALTRRRGAR